MYTSFDETHLDKIVRLLKSHKNGYLSGQRLGNILGLSRASVWKKINTLKKLGYKIQSKKNVGYFLVEKTDLLLPWEVTDGLQTEILGQKIYYFDTIKSTQSFALGLASRPHENGSLVIAKTQTSGRGRQNRRWISPKGGIWLSVLLKPSFEATHAAIFPLITSLALAIAIEKTLCLRPKLKWPNDLTLDNKKVAGVLIDAAFESNKIEYIIIGVGINFKVNPASITKNIKGGKNFYGVTTLVSKKDKIDPLKLLQTFLDELEQIYIKLTTNETAKIKREWRKRSSTLGKTVIMNTPSYKVKGKAIGIDDDGALLVSSGKKVMKFLVGDILYQK